ncbi:MAG: hypothetical protein KGM47_15850, partial [Acidobacteriota bacterium]|nr:hypothetical protein [Acidobacteriota bacterium]
GANVTAWIQPHKLARNCQLLFDLRVRHVALKLLPNDGATAALAFVACLVCHVLFVLADRAGCFATPRVAIALVTVCSA